jgi:hypothetical protein
VGTDVTLFDGGQPVARGIIGAVPWWRLIPACGRPVGGLPVGGRIEAAAPRSATVQAPLEAWRRGPGLPFDRDGTVEVHERPRPVFVSTAEDLPGATAPIRHATSAPP